MSARDGPAHGVLVDGVVRVQDTAQANRLHNKWYAGTPETGNTLRLTLAEAVHAVEAGRLLVEGHDAASLLAHGAAEGERTEVDLLAYRDLRGRGLVARPDSHVPDSYRVWERGAAPPAPPAYRTHARSERAPVTAAGLLAWAGDAWSLVDEDGGVTHYTLAGEQPAGTVPPGDLPAGRGVALADHVLVPDAAAAAAYHEAEHIGTPTGPGLVLSLVEAEALRRRGVLVVADGLALRAASRQPHFSRTLPVYEALRTAGVVARSGFRFGTHLRGYRGRPGDGHADWLFHCAFPDDVLHAADISRAVRVAHGVRKRFCLAVVAPEGVRFLHVAWQRP